MMADDAPLENNKVRSSNDFFLPSQQKLRECLHTLLAGLHPLLQGDSVQAFMMPGKLLAQKEKEQQRPEGSWALLSLLISLMLTPEIDHAVANRVAVAIECVICALDLLDDVEDEDQTQIVRELGVARTLNVSTALLMLAQKALLSLQFLNVSAQKITQLLQLCIEDCTDEECIEVAAQKAGALMKLACVSGAVCAGSDDETREQFARMGELLGIAHQLDNDSHDLYYLIHRGLQYSSSGEGINRGNFKTDLVRHKKTLPIVIAMRENKSGAEDALQGEMGEQHMQTLNEGIIATWVISLLYREQAQDLFRTLENRYSISVPLRLLLGFAE